MSSVYRRSSPGPGTAQVLAGLLLACLALLGQAPAAPAHDELTDTEPAAGESLEQAPQQVVLSFSGDLTTLGAQVEVTGPRGSVVDADPQVEGTRLRQPLAADAPPGDYEVVWRVTSQDGHPISGTFDYTVEGAGTQAPSQDDAGGTATSEATGDQTDRERTDQDQTYRDQTDREASTDAVVIESDDDTGVGQATWLWGLVGLAFLALLAVGIRAVRRR